jgi:hypothetical protein
VTRSALSVALHGSGVITCGGVQRDLSPADALAAGILSVSADRSRSCSLLLACANMTVQVLDNLATLAPFTGPRVGSGEGHWPTTEYRHADAGAAVNMSAAINRSVAATAQAWVVQSTTHPKCRRQCAF